MNKSSNKFFKRFDILLLSGLSFLIAYLSPAAYGQVRSQDITSPPIDNNSPIFFFSLGLLFIVVCIIFVLYFNRAQGKQVDERARFEFQRLSFAAVVLVGLALIFVLSMSMYYWSPSGSEAGKTIFETCKTVLPPIITLVLGYYFGKSNQIQSSKEKQNQAGGNGQRESTADSQVSPEVGDNAPNPNTKGDL